MSRDAQETDLRLAAAGDTDAFQRMILRSHASLRATVSQRIQPALARRIDPDDVLQQAYIAAFKALRPKSQPSSRDGVSAIHFDSPAGLHRWLEQIVLNTLKNEQRACRKQKRDVRRERFGDTAGDLVARLTSGQSTPSRQLGREDARAALLSCLARLTPDQRDAIQLRFIDGKSAPEAATALGKTEDAIHALCYRGLKELRSAMESMSHYLTRL